MRKLIFTSADGVEFCAYDNRFYAEKDGEIWIKDKFQDCISVKSEDILHLAEIIYRKRAEATSRFIKKRNKQIIELRTKGHWSYERIAKAYGMTRQGVHYIVKQQEKK